MKRAIIIIILLIISNITVAQTYIGNVQDSENQPIAFANVFAQNSDDNTIINGVITDELGNFELPIKSDKPFLLKISYIGYLPYQQEISSKSNTKLSSITLELDNSTLDEVVIVQKKRLIEKRSDHFLINLGSRNFIKNTNSWQALKKAPLISAKENSGLTILGKDDVIVYINNRKSNFSGESLMNYLKNLSADRIQKVEIYTSPPARFDAQGNGVVNIILKANPQEGLVGSFSGNYTRSKYSSGRGSLDLNYNKNKWNIYSSTWLSEGSVYVNEKSEQFFPNQQNSSNHETDRLNPSNFNIGSKLGFDYQASDKHLFGLLLDYNYNKPTVENTTISNYYTGNALDSITKTTVDGETKKYNYNLNFNHLYTIDSLGTNLSWNFNYFNYKNEQYTDNNNFLNNSSIPSQLPSDNFNSNVVQKIDNYNLKADYYKVLSEKWNLSLGLQYFQTNTDNEIQLRRFNQNNYVIDPNTSNLFEFKEQISSAYVSAKYNPNEQWNYSVGLRFEHTSQKGYQQSTDTRNTNEYNNLFPSAYIKYASNQKNILSLSVNNRIVRPSFWELNPFRYYITPQIYSDGNPFLNPAKTLNTELSYVLNSKHTFLLNYNRQTDVFGQLSRIIDDNILNYYRDNYGVYDSFGGTYIYNFKLLNGKFESQFTGNATYKKLTANPAFNEAFSADGLELDLRSYNYYYFLKDKSLEACVDFYYHKYGPIAQSTLSPVFSMDFTLSKNFNNWYVSLFFQDILRSDIYKFSLTENNYHRTNENYYDTRKIALSVRYSFGKNTVKSKRNRNTNSSIRNRVN